MKQMEIPSLTELSELNEVKEEIAASDAESTSSKTLTLHPSQKRTLSPCF